MPGFILSGASLASPGPSTTPAVNTRSRLEGLPLSADLQPALSAEVADPLWLLCRQWQFLEFAGEDAGTPIDVRVEGERSELSRLPRRLARRRQHHSGARLPGRRPRARDGGRGRAGPRPSRPAGRRGRGPAAVDAQRRPAERPVRGGLPLRPGPRRRGGPHRRRVAGPGRHPQHRRPRPVRRAHAAAGRHRGSSPGCLRSRSSRPSCRTRRSSGSVAGCAGTTRPWSTRLAEAWNPARQEYAFAVSAQTSSGEVVAGRRRVHGRRARLVLVVRRPRPRSERRPSRDHRSRIPPSRCCPRRSSMRVSPPTGSGSSRTPA